MGSPRWIHTSSTYVRPRTEGQPDAWTEEAAKQGGVGSNRLREVVEIPAPAAVAADLDIPQGESVVVRRRLVLMDGEPVELADSYYPASIARATPLAQTGKIRGGAVTLLAEMGYRPQTVDEAISARPATPDERDLLNLELSDWVLVLRRITKDLNGVPFECSEMTMVASGRELRYELQEEG